MFQYPLSTLCPMLSLEEVPALCCRQVKGGSPIVSVFLYVVHRNFKPLRSLKLIQRKVKEEEEEEEGKLVNATKFAYKQWLTDRFTVIVI